MARVQVSDTITSSSGAPVPGVSVSITVHGGGTATLWAQEVGAASLTSLFTDGTGSFEVWLDEGRYDISVGNETRTIEVISRSTIANLLAKQPVPAGPLGSRPAAGVAGNAFFGIDTGLFYVDNGTSWITVNPATNAPITLATSAGGDVSGTFSALQVNSASGAAFTVAGKHVVNGGAVLVSATNGSYCELFSSGSGANLKRARLVNSAGGTYLRAYQDDDLTVAFTGIHFDHATGSVDFPTATLTRNGQQIWAAGDAIPGLSPIGAMQDYAGTTDPNAQWMICDGRAISRSTYATCFTNIGTAFGIGDGSTTFNLPDFRSRSALGAGQGTGLTNRPIGAKGGEENHTLLGAEMPVHSHGGATGTGTSGTDSPDHVHAFAGATLLNLSGGFSAVGTGGQGVGTQTQTGGASTRHSHSIPALAIGNDGGGGAHNNMQPFLAVNKIIRVL